MTKRSVPHSAHKFDIVVGGIVSKWNEFVFLCRKFGCFAYIRHVCEIGNEGRL